MSSLEPPIGNPAFPSAERATSLHRRSTQSRSSSHRTGLSCNPIHCRAFLFVCTRKSDRLPSPQTSFFRCGSPTHSVDNPLHRWPLGLSTSGHGQPITRWPLGLSTSGHLRLLEAGNVILRRRSHRIVPIPSRTSRRHTTVAKIGLIKH